MAVSINGTSGVSGVDGSAGTPALQGSDTNTGISFGTDEVAINTGGTERVKVDDSGRLLVGTSSAFDTYNTGTNYLAGLEKSGTGSYAALALKTNSNDATGAYLALSKSRSTTANGKALVSNSDTLGEISFEGTDGTSILAGAFITAKVDGTPGLNDLPTRLVFSTTADGASSPTERMRIQKDGTFTSMVGIYNDTTGSAANVNVNSSGSLLRSTSSGKYKTSIETLEDSYADALLNCRPVWYRSLCSQDNPAHGFWGFIAEEVAEIDPRLVSFRTTEVTYDEETGAAINTPCDPVPEGVQYDRFVPHLLNLIKRQQAAIETLEAKVAALEGGAS